MFYIKAHKHYREWQSYHPEPFYMTLRGQTIEEAWANAEHARLTNDLTIFDPIVIDSITQENPEENEEKELYDKVLVLLSRCVSETNEKKRFNVVCAIINRLKEYWGIKEN